MRKIIQHTSWLLLLVFGLIITPKELIHEFYGHEDTHCNSGNDQAFESHHHHCDILQLTSLVYTAPGKSSISGVVCVQFATTLPAVQNPAVPSAVYFNLRAPPLS
jgi:hypothetical protein